MADATSSLPILLIVDRSGNDITDKTQPLSPLVQQEQPISQERVAPSQEPGEAQQELIQRMFSRMMRAQIASKTAMPYQRRQSSINRT